MKNWILPPIEFLNEKYIASLFLQKEKHLVWMDLIKSTSDQNLDENYGIKLANIFLKIGVHPLEHNAFFCATNLLGKDWDEKTKEMAKCLQKTGFISQVDANFIKDIDEKSVPKIIKNTINQLYNNSNKLNIIEKLKKIISKNKKFKDIVASLLIHDASNGKITLRESDLLRYLIGLQKGLVSKNIEDDARLYAQGILKIKRNPNDIIIKKILKNDFVLVTGGRNDISGFMQTQLNTKFIQFEYKGIGIADYDSVLFENLTDLYQQPITKKSGNYIFLAIKKSKIEFLVKEYECYQDFDRLYLINFKSDVFTFCFGKKDIENDIIDFVDNFLMKKMEGKSINEIGYRNIHQKDEELDEEGCHNYFFDIDRSILQCVSKFGWDFEKILSNLIKNGINGDSFTYTLHINRMYKDYDGFVKENNHLIQKNPSIEYIINMIKNKGGINNIDKIIVEKMLHIHEIYSIKQNLDFIHNFEVPINEYGRKNSKLHDFENEMFKENNDKSNNIDPKDITENFIIDFMEGNGDVYSHIDIIGCRFFGGNSLKLIFGSKKLKYSIDKTNDWVFYYYLCEESEKFKVYISKKGEEFLRKKFNRNIKLENVAVDCNIRHNFFNNNAGWDNDYYEEIFRECFNDLFFEDNIDDYDIVGYVDFNDKKYQPFFKGQFNSMKKREYPPTFDELINRETKIYNFLSPWVEHQPYGDDEYLIPQKIKYHNMDEIEYERYIRNFKNQMKEEVEKVFLLHNKPYPKKEVVKGRGLLDIYETKQNKTGYTEKDFGNKTEFDVMIFLSYHFKDWSYKKKIFELEGKEITPEFYLKESKTCVFVKGYIDKRFETFIKQFYKKYGKEYTILIATYYEDTLCYVLCNPTPLNYKMYYSNNLVHDKKLMKLSLSSEYVVISSCKKCKNYFVMEETGTYQCPCCGEYDGDHHLDEWKHINLTDGNEVNGIEIKYNNYIQLIEEEREIHIKEKEKTIIDIVHESSEETMLKVLNHILNYFNEINDIYGSPMKIVNGKTIISIPKDIFNNQDILHGYCVDDHKLVQYEKNIPFSDVIISKDIAKVLYLYIKDNFSDSQGWVEKLFEKSKEWIQDPSTMKKMEKEKTENIPPKKIKKKPIQPIKKIDIQKEPKQIIVKENKEKQNLTPEEYFMNHFGSLFTSTLTAQNFLKFYIFRQEDRMERTKRSLASKDLLCIMDWLEKSNIQYNHKGIVYSEKEKSLISIFSVYRCTFIKERESIELIAKSIEPSIRWKEVYSILCSDIKDKYDYECVNGSLQSLKFYQPLKHSDTEFRFAFFLNSDEKIKTDLMDIVEHIDFVEKKPEIKKLVENVLQSKEVKELRDYKKNVEKRVVEIPELSDILSEEDKEKLRQLSLSQIDEKVSKIDAMMKIDDDVEYIAKKMKIQSQSKNKSIDSIQKSLSLNHKPKRSKKVRDYAIERAKGRCELCNSVVFLNKKEKFAFKVHHVDELGEGGDDEFWNVGAICSSCHDHIHHGLDGEVLNELLRKKILQKEKDLGHTIDFQ